MATLDSVKSFLNEKEIAVAGVSRIPQKFGNSAFKGLIKAGYTVFPVNPMMDSYEDQRCYHSVTQLKGECTNLLLVVPPKQSMTVLADAVEAGFTTVWFQPGSESEQTAEFCKQNGLSFIEKECILMYVEPVVSAHKWHRFFKKLFGKYPK